MDLKLVDQIQHPFSVKSAFHSQKRNAQTIKHAHLKNSPDIKPFVARFFFLQKVKPYPANTVLHENVRLLHIFTLNPIILIVTTEAKSMGPDQLGQTPRYKKA